MLVVVRWLFALMLLLLLSMLLLSCFARVVVACFC